MSKILATLLLLVVACNQPTDEVTDAYAATTCPSTPLVTYEAHHVITTSEKCQGSLPFINYITLYDNGTALVEGNPGGIVLWQKNGSDLVLSYVQVRGWTSTITLVPTAPGEYGADLHWHDTQHAGFRCDEWRMDIKPI